MLTYLSTYSIYSYMHNTADFRQEIKNNFQSYDNIEIGVIDVVNRKEVYLTYHILGGQQCSTICKYKLRKKNWFATSTDIRIPISNENVEKEDFIDILPHRAFQTYDHENSISIHWSSKNMNELYRVLDAIDSESELFVE